jgi:hypothetical protein
MRPDVVCPRCSVRTPYGERCGCATPLQGRELDAAVFQHIFGYRPDDGGEWISPAGETYSENGGVAPGYHLDRNLLPQVLAKVEERGRAGQFAALLADQYHEREGNDACGWGFWLLAHCPLETILNAALDAVRGGE